MRISSYIQSIYGHFWSLSTFVWSLNVFYHSPKTRKVLGDFKLTLATSVQVNGWVSSSVWKAGKVIDGWMNLKTQIYATVQQYPWPTYVFGTGHIGVLATPSGGTWPLPESTRAFTAVDLTFGCRWTGWEQQTAPVSTRSFCKCKRKSESHVK